MTTRPGPRERLLAATTALSYRHGVGVGLDAILKEADVARRSVYQHFGGKDNLIAEAIAGASTVDLDAIAARMDQAGPDPRARLRAIFGFYVDRAAHKLFRGCRFVAADLGLPDPEHPVHAKTRAHFERLHDMLATELTALAHPDVADAADRLLLVIDGLLAQCGTHPNPGTVPAARALFEHVLDEA
jgi:AcrR family transcriptional regulator